MVLVDDHISSLYHCLCITVLMAIRLIFIAVTFADLFDLAIIQFVVSFLVKIQKHDPEEDGMHDDSVGEKWLESAVHNQGDASVQAGKTKLNLKRSKQKELVWLLCERFINALSRLAICKMVKYFFHHKYLRTEGPSAAKQ